MQEGWPRPLGATSPFWSSSLPSTPSSWMGQMQLLCLIQLWLCLFTWLPRRSSHSSGESNSRVHHLPSAGKPACKQHLCNSIKWGVQPLDPLSFPFYFYFFLPNKRLSCGLSSWQVIAWLHVLTFTSVFAVLMKMEQLFWHFWVVWKDSEVSKTCSSITDINTDAVWSMSSHGTCKRHLEKYMKLVKSFNGLIQQPFLFSDS